MSGCRYSEECGRYTKEGYTCNNPDNLPFSQFKKRWERCEEFNQFEEKYNAVVA